VVQERWFQPQQPQFPQQFSYEKPNLPRREMATQWESITAPVQNDLGQVVGDLMQQGIEPERMEGLSARELASIRDALTNEKVAVDTQTEKTTNFPVSTQTWDSPKIPSMTMGTQTQKIPRRLPTFSDESSTFGLEPKPSSSSETQTWAEQKTFGSQTEPPSQTTFASQTDAPGFNTIGTQLGRTPVKKPVPLLPPVPKLPTRSRPTFSTVGTEARPLTFEDVANRKYADMFIEELRVAVRYKAGDGAGNLLKPALLNILNAEDPKRQLAIEKRKPAIEPASPAMSTDSAFEGAIKTEKRAERPVYVPPNKGKPPRPPRLSKS
jgi:hypothetical protein